MSDTKYCIIEGEFLGTISSNVKSSTNFALGHQDNIRWTWSDARSFARQFRRLFYVFFHKVNYLTGYVSLSEDYCDHVWVTKEVMEDLVKPEYYKTLNRFKT